MINMINPVTKLPIIRHRKPARQLKHTGVLQKLFGVELLCNGPWGSSSSAIHGITVEDINLICVIISVELKFRLEAIPVHG